MYEEVPDFRGNGSLEDIVFDNIEPVIQSAWEKSRLGAKGGKKKLGKSPSLETGLSEKEKEAYVDVEVESYVESECCTRNNTPTQDELNKYIEEKGLGFDGSVMFNYYEQTGWKTKNGVQITDWKAAARNWAKREKQNGKNGNDEQVILGGTRFPAGVTPQTESGTGKFGLI